MKKYILFVVIVLNFAGVLKAQNKNGRAPNPDMLQPVKFVPYADYLKEHAADIQRNNSRELKYKTISYSFEVYDDNRADFKWFDSGTFQYSPSGVLQSQDSSKGYTSADTFAVRLRHVYTYDSKGNLVQELYSAGEDKEPNGTFTPISRIIKIYGSANNLLSTTSEGWDKVNSAYTYYKKDSIEYNGSNGKTRNLAIKWISGAWQNVSRSTYTLDGANYSTQQLDETWNTGTSTWVGVLRSTITRNTEHLATEVIYENYTGSTWVNEDKFTNTYDANGNNILSIYSVWLGNKWVTQSKYEFDRSATSKLLESRSYVYDTANSVYVQRSQNTYTYNSADLEISWIQRIWNFDSLKIVNYSKSVNTYTNNNMLSLREYYQWYGFYSKLDSIEFINDANGNLATEFFWMKGHQGFEPYERWNYHYAQFDVQAGVSQTENELGASIFPNPAVGDVQLRFDLDQAAAIEISIYDADGRIVSIESGRGVAGTNQINIDASMIPAGNYYLQLASGGKTSILKFLRR